MAPVAPLGRKAAIRRVAEGRLPIWLGSPHPIVAIVEQDGLFRIRDLVIDEAEAQAAARAALTAGHPWMPEHHYALGKPTGTIHEEARTRQELAAKMVTMSWPSHW